MRRRFFTGAVVALTLAALGLSASEAQAQRRGWGVSTGPRGVYAGPTYDGYRYGGYRYDGWNRAYNQPYYGSYDGWNRGYYQPYYGSYYGDRSWYGNRYYPQSYYYSSPRVGYDSASTVVPAVSYPATTQAYQSYYPPVQTTAASSARIRVRVSDPNAQLWINGSLTQQRGSDRIFETPALSASNTNTYEIRARGMDDSGNPQDQSRTIQVQPGRETTIDFTRTNQGIVTAEMMDGGGGWHALRYSEGRGVPRKIVTPFGVPQGAPPVSPVPPIIRRVTRHSGGTPFSCSPGVVACLSTGRTFMFHRLYHFAAVVALAALTVSHAASAAAQEKGSHPRLRAALHELREARAALRDSPVQWPPGYKERGVQALDDAIASIKTILAVKDVDNFRGVDRNPDFYTKYKDHPRLRAALDDVRDARDELRLARADFGGLKDRALDDLDIAAGILVTLIRPRTR